MGNDKSKSVDTGQDEKESREQKVKAGMEQAKVMEERGSLAPDSQSTPVSVPQTSNETYGKKESNNGIPEEEPAMTVDGEIRLPVGIIDDGGIVHSIATVKGLSGKIRVMLAQPECRKNGGRALSTLLRECVTSIGDLQLGSPEKDYILDLTVPDRDVLAFAIRQKSSGLDDEIETTGDCPHCEEKINISFTLDNLETTNVSETIFKPEGKNWVGYFKNEKLGCDFKLKLPNGKIQEKVVPFGKTNPVKMAYLTLQLSLLEYNGQINFRKNFIEEELDLEHLDWIDKKFGESSPGLNTMPLIQCEECGQTFPAKLDIVDFMFNRQR